MDPEWSQKRVEVCEQQNEKDTFSKREKRTEITRVIALSYRNCYKGRFWSDLITGRREDGTEQ